MGISVDAFYYVDVMQGIITSDYYSPWVAEMIAIDE